MLIVFYNIFITIYQAFIKLASLLGKEKAKLWVSGRKDWRKKLSQALDKRKEGQAVYWMHCASLGEFEQGRPLLEALKTENPKLFFVLTFFSPSGYEVRKQYNLADYVAYLPMDSAQTARDFVHMLNPEKVFFIKYEFWYHYLHELKKQGRATYLVSAQFRPKQAFFKPWGGFFRSMLGAFKGIFVQNEPSKALLAAHTPFAERVFVSGDTRWDRVATVRQQELELPLVTSFAKGRRVLVAGSSWPQDEQLLRTWLETAQDWVLLLAPHELHKGHLQQIEARFTDLGLAWHSQSNLAQVEQARVLVLDSLGLLSTAYRYGNLAYIGGGFGVGIHNCLEAAVYAMPVAFGPRYEKFEEAKALLAQGLAVCVENVDDLKQYTQSFDNQDNLRNFKAKAQPYVDTQLGAVHRILERL